VLDGKHEIVLDVATIFEDRIALQNSKAVFSGDRTAKAVGMIADDLMYFVRSRQKLFGGDSFWRNDPEMDIAVAKMAEGDDPGSVDRF